jgi:hypothetical protein
MVVHNVSNFFCAHAGGVRQGVSTNCGKLKSVSKMPGPAAGSLASVSASAKSEQVKQ